MTERDEKALSALKVRLELSYFKVSDLFCLLVHAQPWLAFLACLPRQQDVRVTLLPVDTPGYKLEFEFAENEFFTNTILTKVYYYEVSLASAMTCMWQLVDLSSCIPGRARLPGRLRVQEDGRLRYLVEGRREEPD